MCRQIQLLYGAQTKQQAIIWQIYEQVYKIIIILCIKPCEFYVPSIFWFPHIQLFLLCVSVRITSIKCSLRTLYDRIHALNEHVKIIHQQPSFIWFDKLDLGVRQKSICIGLVPLFWPSPQFSSLPLVRRCRIHLQLLFRRKQLYTLNYAMVLAADFSPLP